MPWVGRRETHALEQIVSLLRQLEFAVAREDDDTSEQRSRDHQADVLSFVHGVRRLAGGSGRGFERTRGVEREAEASGGEPESGETGAQEHR